MLRALAAEAGDRLAVGNADGRHAVAGKVPSPQPTDQQLAARLLEAGVVSRASDENAVSQDGGAGPVSRLSPRGTRRRSTRPRASSAEIVRWHNPATPIAAH